MTYNLKFNLKSALFSLTLLGILSSCSSTPVDHQYPDKDREKMEKYGSVLGNSDGITLFGDSKKKTNTSDNNSGIGVNSFLWRATLDTLAFMPILSADPFGGTILTDWYSPPSTPNERFKINALILDRQLRSDGIKVTIFQQEFNNKMGWRNVAVSPQKVLELENTILTRARQLKIAKSDS